MFTHAVWKVRPGSEDAFVAAWDDLAERFSALPQPPLWGTLIRSLGETQLFVSFGSWPNRAALQAMREDEESRAGLERLRALCIEATPGTFELVRHVHVSGPGLLTQS